MASENLNQKIEKAGGPIELLRNSPSGRFHFPYPDQHTNWQDEQAAWGRTAVLFDQSHHMTDVYFRGPDVARLLQDTGTNSFKTFRQGKSKHFIACNPSGKMIGSAILFGLKNDEVNLVGPAAAANWVQYQAETGGYDVEVTRDERTVENTGKRQTFRYEIEGPAARAIVEKANGGPLGDVKFFEMTEFDLGGVRVQALAHTMVGVPGTDAIGLEFWGPLDQRDRAIDAILAAGEEFGLVRAGALAYYTGSVEAGYMAQPTAAVYTGDDLHAYRDWLPGNGYEGKLSIGGSYRSDNVEDYYVTPYDFGYGHLVKFDHDFIGRDALEQVVDQPHRKHVWLRWNDEDVTRVYASSLFGGEGRAKYLETPLARYARVQSDAVLFNGELAGISTLCAYTVNVGSWFSAAMVDAEHAADGTELTLLWGEEGGGTRKRNVESHTQTEIRVTVHTSPLA
mgnify:CR=1 FL=1